ncbi:hypothetical protein ANCDUO_00960 [Ancylostoma duodenale]|uniref:Uncharacterized protein n=1 Tax=Ancylostoma duodenale TaxID=51022 RepID=A0A0C2HAP3_9BILA|nr:hypothetical protein ANCDUO_00960 [Ancylostoma duodenale]
MKSGRQSMTQRFVHSYARTDYTREEINYDRILRRKAGQMNQQEGSHHHSHGWLPNLLACHQSYGVFYAMKTKKGRTVVYSEPAYKCFTAPWDTGQRSRIADSAHMIDTLERLYF